MIYSEGNFKNHKMGHKIQNLIIETHFLQNSVTKEHYYFSKMSVILASRFTVCIFWNLNVLFFLTCNILFFFFLSWFIFMSAKSFLVYNQNILIFYFWPKKVFQEINISMYSHPYFLPFFPDLLHPGMKSSCMLSKAYLKNCQLCASPVPMWTVSLGILLTNSLKSWNLAFVKFSFPKI